MILHQCPRCLVRLEKKIDFTILFEREQLWVCPKCKRFKRTVKIDLKTGKTEHFESGGLKE